MSERRRSSLLSQLGRAQTKISALEEFIRDRERQFHTAVTRLESRPQPGGGTTRRRVGLSHDLLRMRSLSSSSTEEHRDESGLAQPLAEYIKLKITRILDSEDTPIPFILRRLLSREYHIGPEGAIIGSGPNTTITVPKEADIMESHVQIKWNSALNVETTLEEQLTGCHSSKLTRQSQVSAAMSVNGHFVLSNLATGEGSFYLLPATPCNRILEQPESTFEEDDSSVSAFLPNEGSDSKLNVALDHGVRFVAGRLEFTITALPLSQLLTIRAFAAAMKGDLAQLKSVVEFSTAAGVTSSHIVVTPTHDTKHNRYSTVTVTAEEGFDPNVEYQPPVYDDEGAFSNGMGQRQLSVSIQRIAATISPISPILTEQGLGVVTHRLLLHIAIERKDLDMVKYLLGIGADVNLCSGELQQNALHLAALINVDEIMVELLRHGGDIEIRDAKHYQPIALTTSYKIRKLLLGTMLLCAASEAGDSEEVIRLVSTSDISPNACGLRHKNALHLSCAQGHMEVTNFLILNGANINNKGGSRLRTPLHYASLNNHVKLAAMLLEAGANEFARDLYGYTPLNLSMGGDMCKLLHKDPLSLCLAAQSGDVEGVQQILAEYNEESWKEEKVKLVDQRNEKSHAPLHIACTTGNLVIARLLVSHGADLNLPGGTNNWTPIFYAAIAGYEQIVDFLLSVGASTEILDREGKSIHDCVDKAVEESSEQLRKLSSGRLVSTVEDPKINLQIADTWTATMIRQESASSCSAEQEKAWLSRRLQQLKRVIQLLTSGPERLLKAIQTKNFVEFKELLESKAVDPNTQIDKFFSSPPLVRVCEEGLLEFAKVLVENGANINEQGTSDQIPLFVAARSGRTDIVQFLIEKGANVELKSMDSRSTVLHEAAKSDSLDTVEYLLSLKGVDLNAADSNGETPFDCSTVMETKMLLASGANQLLMAASIGDDNEIKRLLVKEGISVNQEFKHGLTALHEACDAERLSTVQLLIEQKANINKQTLMSQLSPLHIACQNNFIDIAKVLLNAGAKLDLMDSDGKVPFEVAYTNQMRKILVEARSLQVPPLTIGDDSSPTEKKCMICMDNAINTIILPCGHQAFCTECVSRISICALDRQIIKDVITVYK